MDKYIGKIVNIVVDQGDDLDYLRISSGIVHRNEDDAIKHAIALIGLTC